MSPEAKLSKIVAKLQLPFEPAKLQLEDALEGFLCERFGLYYDVGGGKTLVATLIAMMLDLPTVVVMPHILLPQWKRWLIRARVPESEIYTYYGPKRVVVEAFATGDYDGFDGELVVGEPNASDVYRKTYSGVMSESGEPDFTFWVFGRWDEPATKFKDLTYVVPVFPPTGAVELVKQVKVSTYDELADLEAESLAEGYEGGMYRWSEALYKYGRSTKKEMGIMKIKRFEEDDLVVLGFECAYRNDNEAVEDNLGYTKRSSHKENLVPIERVGKFLCRMPDGTIEKVATGNFNHEALEFIWQNKEDFVGKILKVKHFSHGVKDKLRHARAVHWRADFD